MALIKCRECGHDVSTLADKCTNCGAPVENLTLTPEPKKVELKEHPGISSKIEPVEDSLFIILIVVAILIILESTWIVVGLICWFIPVIGPIIYFSGFIAISLLCLGLGIRVSLKRSICPYCNNPVDIGRFDRRITCPACNKRSVIRSGELWRVEDVVSK